MPKDIILPENSRRLLELDKILRQGRQNAKPFEWILSRLRNCGFKTSRRTLNRDIALLRKKGAKIKVEYRDGEEAKVQVPHWYYEDPSWTIAPRQATKGTIYSLLTAQRAMAQYIGLPLADDIHRVIEDCWPAFTRKIVNQNADLVPIRFISQTEPQFDSNVWRAVFTATRERRRLRMTYVNGWGNERKRATTRDTAPYHIVNLQGTWYLLGSASRKNVAYRQYALSRITHAEILNETIDIPNGFDIDAIVKNSFGQFLGRADTAVEIHVRFSKNVAPLVGTRRIALTETRHVLGNGDIEVRFKASPDGPLPYYNIRNWVLSWGTDIEVLAPQQLKDEVDKEIATLAKRLFPPAASSATPEQTVEPMSAGESQ